MPQLAVKIHRSSMHVIVFMMKRDSFKEQIPAEPWNAKITFDFI
jgi:hypothetical protein